ncbi:MAG: dihydroxyacetone kinase subunit [Pseudomonadota bacterium]
MFDRVMITRLIEACHDMAMRNEDYLCELDRAIGDGDHGTNMARGLNAVFNEREHLSELSFGDALSSVGMLLVMTVGGASGPLYGTLLIELGKGVQSNLDFDQALLNAVRAVAKRGRSEFGDKTLLDVLYPLQAAVSERRTYAEISDTGWQAALMTKPLRANRGRASYLGDRSMGHIDPGAASCALLIKAICESLSDARTLPEVTYA